MKIVASTESEANLANVRRELADRKAKRAAKLAIGPDDRDALNLLVVCVAEVIDRLEGRPLDRMGTASTTDLPDLERLMDRLLEIRG